MMEFSVKETIRTLMSDVKNPKEFSIHSWRVGTIELMVIHSKLIK